MKTNRTLKLIYGGLFIALSIVATRFLSITTPLLRVGFGFLPLAVAGMYFGPLFTAVVAAIADLLGFFMFPFGTFFPGFTLSALVTGGIYGYFFQDTRMSLRNVVLGVGLVTVVVNIGMNTYWLHLIQGVPYLTLLLTRFFNQVIIAFVQVPTILLIHKYLVRHIRLKAS